MLRKIIHIRQWNKIILCQPAFYTKAMRALLKEIEPVFHSPLKILKDDISSTVIVAKVDGRELIIKRANTKGWLHFCRRSVCCSRARRSWHYANELRHLGINTFQPIALIEECFGPFKGRSYFICSYLQGVSLLEYFKQETFPKERADIAASIWYLLEQLADNGLEHHDLNLSNILIRDNQPWLIDLDSMRKHRFKIAMRRAKKRERKQFIENWREIKEMAPYVLSLFENTFNRLDLIKKNG